MSASPVRVGLDTIGLTEGTLKHLDILNQALRGAMISGDLGALDALIEAGADINARDLSGQTALHLAASHSTPGVVKALVERGSDVTVVDSERRTALHCAVEAMNPLVLGALIDGGIDVEAEDERGQTAAQIARECRMNHTSQVLKALCEKRGKKSPTDRFR